VISCRGAPPVFLSPLILVCPPYLTVLSTAKETDPRFQKVARGHFQENKNKGSGVREEQATRSRLVGPPPSRGEAFKNTLIMMKRKDSGKNQRGPSTTESERFFGHAKTLGREDGTLLSERGPQMFLCERRSYAQKSKVATEVS